MRRKTVVATLLCLTTGFAGAQDLRDPNDDGIFDAADLATLATSLGNWNPELHPEYDLDQNGILDARDFQFVARVINANKTLPPIIQVSAEVTNGIFVTREATYEVSISVEGATGDFMVTEGSNVLLTGTGTGSGTAVLKLEVGKNLFALTFEDAAGNTVLRELEILRDVTPPQIVLESPGPGDLVTQQNVPVSGQALDSDTSTGVRVNGVAMTINPDGSFFGAVPFTLDAGGQRKLTAVATDAAGNTAQDDVEFELFVSPPETLETGSVRMDLPPGAICRRGEEPSLSELNNGDVKSMLGPGSEMIVSSPPGGGLTDGVIVLPNAMMVAVEGQSTENQGVVGAVQEPLFANRPEISLQNVTGATNAMPVWIFQVIPDADGDGMAELSLVSRAKVAEDGPNAGRVVPVDDPDLDFPGVFNDESRLFDEEALRRYSDVPAIRNLLDRMDEKRSRGEDPKARVTFFCCAASAAIPVKGRIRCGTYTATQIIDRLIAAENDLRQIAIDMNASAQRMVDAENTRIGAVSDIAGLTDVPLPGGGKVSVPTLLNGKAYGCLKNFVPASKALDRINDIGAKLGDLGLVQLALGQANPPLQETAIALTDKAIDHAETRLRARAETAALDEFHNIVGNVDKLKEYKKKLGVLNDAYNCAALGFRVGQLITSVTTIFTEPDVTDALQASYDIKLRVYKRLADCYRQNIAVTESGRGGDGAFRTWLEFQRDTQAIQESLGKLDTFAGEALSNDEEFADLLEEMAALLEPGHTQSVAEQTDLLDRLVALLEDESSLIMRQDEVFEGFDALADAAMMTPVLVERVTEARDIIANTNTSAFEDAGGYPGAYVTLQGSGSPLATMTGPGGSYVHFVNSALRIDLGPPKVAIFDGRTYDVDSGAEDGLLTGAGSGSVDEQVFPFTPFDTVDFDVLLELPDVVINSTVVDNEGNPPTVEIQTPSSTQPGIAGQPMLVEVMSSDDIAVMGVEVTVNGESETGLPGGFGRGVIRMPDEPGSVMVTAIAADAGGNLATDSVTIDVVDGLSAFTISPDRVNIGLGENIQFTANLLGNDVSTEVRWLINNIEGGNPELTGSISPDGVFDTKPLDVGATLTMRSRPSTTARTSGAKATCGSRATRLRAPSAKSTANSAPSAPTTPDQDRAPIETVQAAATPR